MRLKKIRGSILAMAMAFMFVLITIVIAMHTSQSRAVRSVTQAEGELQFREASEFAAAKLFSDAQAAPGWLKVSAEPEMVGDFDMPASYATKLWTGLPDWNPKDQEYAPGHRTYKLKPETSDSALKVFAGNYGWLVAHDSGGYAAYAPKGKIELEQAVGWANPNFQDERPSAEAYSGVPFLLGSLGAITVEKMPYGSAYSEQGPIDLGDSTTDLAMAFQGVLPLRHYETALKQSLSDARTSMEASAASGDKTKDIEGGVLATVSAVFDMLKSGQPNLNVTLEQAMGFPFPMIPGFSLTVPGVFFEFWFHMPYPPDFADAGSGDGGQAEKNGEALKKIEGEIKALQAKIAAETDPQDRADLEEDLQNKLNERESLQDAIKAQSDALGAEVKSKTPDTPPGAPDTRNDDKNIPDTGMKGWNYSKLLSKMLGLLLDTISGDLDGIAKSVSANVRLVHFGGMDNVPDFRFDDGFYAKATWTVPRGRSFRYQGKMTVMGDLWLQKGSTMHVGGDLVLINPDATESTATKPSGKLVMEEGSTLIVDGDATLAGDPKYGSLWVCTPPSHIAPVTSGIFVKKTIKIPYGSFSATNLEDTARAIEGMGAAADALQKLSSDVAPNTAKIAGPFHERQPYFASYATTFQLTLVYHPFGPPIPVPTPVPLPKPNILIPLFRTLTTLYSATLNMSLGENLYTHADWWGYGEGVVPAMIKLNPAGPMNAIKGLDLDGIAPNLDWDNYLGDLVTTVLQGAAEFAIKTVGKALITEVLTSIVPGGSALSTLLGDLVNQIDLKDDAFETFKKKVVDAALGPVTGQLAKVKDKLDQEVKDAMAEAYLREVGGPLIYADTIVVGDLADPPLLMAGMLVADKNIIVDTQSFVGSLTSFEGDIKAAKVYYSPMFTRASLYKPKSAGTTALERMSQYQYGSASDSGQAVDVSTGVWQTSTESWSR